MVVSKNESPTLSNRAPPGLLLGLFLGLFLGGCSGGDGSSKVVESAERPEPLADPSLLPEPLLVIEGDPSRIAAVPDIVAVEILSDSGLQIAYTRGSQREKVDPRYLGGQWQHMQNCVGIVAPAPLVVIVAGTIEPLIATDDVLRDIEGHITASAGTGADGIAAMQVHERDFDGSLGNPGFALRSIMGRHLWLSATLPERDYPFRCARTTTEAERVPDEPAASPPMPFTASSASVSASPRSPFSVDR